MEFSLTLLQHSNIHWGSLNDNGGESRYGTCGFRSNLGKELTSASPPDLWALFTEVTLGFKGPFVVGTNPVSEIVNIGGDISIDLLSLLSLSEMS
jgi:hypothetical protein